MLKGHKYLPPAGVGAGVWDVCDVALTFVFKVFGPDYGHMS